MKLKGDLDSIGLSELLKTLAEQRATGVLAVTSSMGEKQISLGHGEIAILSDKLAERARIGDLLIARGKLTESQLSDGLKAQRASPRTRLGDLLVSQNIITPKDITDALQFMVEEEIYDLFTWKHGTFDFDGEKSIDEELSEDGNDKNLHRLFIDPQAIIAEATRRIPDWNTIESRLPTPYLCFKLSPKGEELTATASLPIQRLIRLLKEGRTIETAVKRSYVGRLNVCKAIIKMLDDGWIFPYPAVDLPMLASEHRTAKRFSDALNICRRLMDVTEDDAERAELQKLIDDIVEDINQARESGEAVEGSDVVSHKDAANRYKRRQRIWNIAKAIFLAAAAVVIALLVAVRFRPPTHLPEAYLNAKNAANEAAAAEKFDEAVDVWEKFYSTLSDKEGDVAGHVQDNLKSLRGRYITYIENQLHEVRVTEQQDRLDEAEAGYNRLIEKYPNHMLAAEMRNGVKRIQTQRESKRNEYEKSTLQNNLEAASTLLRNKNYTLARKKYTEISDSAPPNSEGKRTADETLKKLAEIEARSVGMLKTGEDDLRAKNGEKAIASFDAASSEWRDLPSAETARQQSQRLRKVLDGLKDGLKDAQSAQANGQLLDAVETLRALPPGLAEFELARQVKAQLDALNGTVAQLDKQIADAQTAYKSGDKPKARRLFNDLVKANEQFLAARNVSVPVLINSRPQGANLQIDGRPIGPTPQDVMLPVAHAFTIRLDHQGYAFVEKQFERLPKDLEILEPLNRGAIAAPLDFGLGNTAPMRLIDGTLYIFHGGALSALEPSGKLLWTIPGDKLSSEPPAADVDESGWPSPPIQIEHGKLLLALKSKEVIEITLENRSVKKILVLPDEPVGNIYIEQKSLRAGATLLAVACADGQLRVYDLAKPSEPLWENPVAVAAKSPKASARKLTVSAGLFSHTHGEVLVLGSNGILTGFNLVDGKTLWSKDLSGQMSEKNSFPESIDESLASFIFSDGRVAVVDLLRQESLFELPVEKALDGAISAITAENGIFAITRDGMVSKFGREQTAGVNPTPLWQRKLDGTSEIPMAAGKALYIAERSGHVYALAKDDGHPLWDYRTDSKPVQIAAFANYVYVMTSDGKLLILSAE